MHDRPTAARLPHHARLLPLIAAALLLTAAPARAGMGPLGFTAFGGWYTHPHDNLVGAGVRAGLGPITITPNAEYVFVDGGKHYTLNLDATWTLFPVGVASAWIGGGLARHVTDPDSGPTDRRSGFDMIGGAGLNAVPLKPFIQFKVVVMDGDDPKAVTIGARF
jgi:hypothetical protein